jgi:hypothetical protein
MSSARRRPATREEIKRQLPGRSPPKADELWECLYLTLTEIERLLAHVRDLANTPWIYPLVATAAHAGAREGELLYGSREESAPSLTLLVGPAVPASRSDSTMRGRNFLGSVLEPV